MDTTRQKKKVYKASPQQVRRLKNSFSLIQLTSPLKAVDISKLLFMSLGLSARNRGPGEGDPPPPEVVDEVSENSKLLVRLSTMLGGLDAASSVLRSSFFTLAETEMTLSMSRRLGLWGRVNHFSQTRGIPISDKCSSVLTA